MLVITADESDSPQSDATACCGEGAGPELAAARHRRPGRRPDRRPGDLALDQPATRGARPPYNHYSLLASIEDIFGLPHLGYAQTDGLNRFGLDVYNNGWK